jgi:hypothetical protein
MVFVSSKYAKNQRIVVVSYAEKKNRKIINNLYHSKEIDIVERRIGLLLL